MAKEVFFPLSTGQALTQRENVAIVYWRLRVTEIDQDSQLREATLKIELQFYRKDGSGYTYNYGPAQYTTGLNSIQSADGSSQNSTELNKSIYIGPYVWTTVISATKTFSVGSDGTFKYSVYAFTNSYSYQNIGQIGDSGVYGWSALQTWTATIGPISSNPNWKLNNQLSVKTGTNTWKTINTIYVKIDTDTWKTCTAYVKIS